MTDTDAPIPLKLPARRREDFAAFLRQPFEPRALEMMALPMTTDDVIITTYPKSGTTWTQQICHGLRSGGDMDFREISWVAPWIERGHMFGIDTRIEQRFRPRVFKTHLPYAHVNKGARYLHVVRDPKDVLVSFYGFLSHGIIDPAAISLDDFAETWLLADLMQDVAVTSGPIGPYWHNYWRHLLDWWAARDEAPVLTIAYEHMRRDLAGQVARIAEFMQLPRDTARLDIATRQATFEFMEAHKDQFSDELPGVPKRLVKVVRGQVGAHRGVVSPALAERIDAAWRHYVTPVLGCASYDEFIAGLE